MVVVNGPTTNLEFSHHLKNHAVLIFQKYISPSFPLRCHRPKQIHITAAMKGKTRWPRALRCATLLETPTFDRDRGPSPSCNRRWHQSRPSIRRERGCSWFPRRCSSRRFQGSAFKRNR